MASPRTRSASVLIFLLLVLAAAGLATLDLEFSDRSGDVWATALERVRRRSTSSDAPSRTDETRNRVLLRVTCREKTGEERRFLIARPTGEDRTLREVVAVARDLFALHFAGSVSVEVIAVEDVGDSGLEISSADDLRAEWE